MSYKIPMKVAEIQLTYKLHNHKASKFPQVRNLLALAKLDALP